MTGLRLLKMVKHIEYKDIEDLNLIDKQIVLRWCIDTLSNVDNEATIKLLKNKIKDLRHKVIEPQRESKKELLEKAQLMGGKII